MPDRNVAGQFENIFFRKYLCDEPHFFVGVNLFAVGRGDTGRFLPAMLQGIQTKEGKARSVHAFAVNAENTTLFAEVRHCPEYTKAK